MSNANPDPFARRRSDLVSELRRDGKIFVEQVLEAIREVPRHLFVPDYQVAQAYENRPLSIGHSQTISQPFVVAYMTQSLQLKKSDKVLEIGTGSGYQSAILSCLVSKVYSIEIVPELFNTASERLKSHGYQNVRVIQGDGALGLPAEAPFDGIILTAAPEELPVVLLEQLAPGGRLIVPLGKRIQNLVIYEKSHAGKIKSRNLLEVVFVPMTGRLGD